VLTQENWQKNRNENLSQNHRSYVPQSNQNVCTSIKFCIWYPKIYISLSTVFHQISLLVILSRPPSYTP